MGAQLICSIRQDRNTGRFLFAAAVTWLYLFILPTDVSAQAPTLDWARQFPGQMNGFGYHIINDAAGNVYSIGTFQGTVDFDPGPGVFNLTAAGGHDIYISKLDTYGNFIWAGQMGGAGDDFGHGITLDSSGNILATGYCTGAADFDPGPGVYTPPQAGWADMFVLKLDASGNFIWAHRIGATLRTVIGFSVDVDNSGNVLVAGVFQGNVDFDPGPATYTLSAATPATTYDIFVLRLSAAGTFSWARRAGSTTQSEYAHSIAVDGAGNCYVTGRFRNTVDFNPGAGVNNLTSAGSEDIFIWKLDASGNYAWAGNMGGAGYDQGYSIAVDGTSHVILTGSYTGTADLDPGPAVLSMTSPGANAIFITKIAPSGALVWSRSIGGVGAAGIGRSVAIDLNNEIYSSGWFSGTVDFDPGAPAELITATLNNMYIMKLDPSGNYKWSLGFETNATIANIFYSVSVDHERNVYATGWFSDTVDFDPGPVIYPLETSDTTFDAFVLKLTQCDTNSSHLRDTVCYQYQLNDSLYTVSGTYTQVLVNAQGCDSIITLELTVLDTVDAFISATDCYTYTLNGVTYTTSGTYVQQLQTAAGCDSLLHLDLTLLDTAYSSVTVSTCGSYEINGMLYDSSGIYTQVLVSAQGCDSLLTLFLTLTDSIHTALDTSACDSFQFFNQYYTTSGFFEHTLTTANGCDSVFGISLELYFSTRDTLHITACDSFDYKGTRYDTGGLYDFHYSNAQGCDSAVTLDLVLGHSAADTLYAVTCNDYAWQDSVYTESGWYTRSLTTALGCDSLLVLRLDKEYLSLTYEVENASCNGIGDGEIHCHQGPAGFTYTLLPVGWINTSGSFSGLTAQTYTVIAEGSAGCRAENELALVDNGCCEQWFLPNSFTPNLDVLNPVFRMYTDAPLAFLDFTIFNRWGELIYEGHDPGGGWDGNYRNEPAPGGVYSYRITFICHGNGREYSLHGKVLLLR